MKKLIFQTMIIAVIVIAIFAANGALKDSKLSNKTAITQQADTTQKTENIPINDIDRNQPAANNSPDSLTATGESKYVRAAFGFLEQNKNHYEILNPREEFVVEGEINDGWHTVILDQVHNGVKVRYGYFSINFGYDGVLTFDDITGSYVSEARKVDTKPLITEEQAKQIAISDTINQGAECEFFEMQLEIARFDKVFHLTWSFGLTSIKGPWLYAIDAKTGKILAVSSGIRR